MTHCAPRERVEDVGDSLAQLPRTFASLIQEPMKHVQSGGLPVMIQTWPQKQGQFGGEVDINDSIVLSDNLF